MKRKRRKAFTLIELMVVIAIIGILSAIAVPKFISATGEAKAAKIQADLRTIGSAAELYYSQNGVYPKSLTDLVSEADGKGFLRSVPEAPSPAVYTLGTSGEVTCVFNGKTYSSYGTAKTNQST